MKRFLFLTSFFLFFTFPISVFATNCEDQPSSSFNSDQLQQFWKEVSDACSKKIDESRNQQQTLQTAIGSINTKINLNQAQINQTQSQINALEKEIGMLATLLDQLSVSVDELRKTFSARLRDTYVHRNTNAINLFFSSESFADFLTKWRYMNIVRVRDQIVLTELDKAKANYDSQKNIKEEKQEEVEKLKTKLESQKKSLVSQQKDKQSLLTQTKNSEKVFRELMQKADAEIAAIKGYTSGASPLSGQTHCDSWGCYYSQRDTQWFYATIGRSSEILGRVGCLITSTAMIASHYGKNLKPSDIASSTDPFFSSTAYMVKGSWSVNGVTVNRVDTSISTSAIDEEINAGRPVIVGLYAGPAHFIVIKGKNESGYIMNDPYMENGYDKSFSDTYSISNITQVNIVRVN